MTGAVLLALAPVALLVALGHLIRRTGFVADAFWPQAERLCYYILLPALFCTAWRRPTCNRCRWPRWPAP